MNTGVPLPLPATAEAAALVARRARDIQQRYGVPFLLENPAHYFSDLPAEPEVGDEFGLMNRILALSGCRQLLDLHNLYCNAINFDFDPVAALDRVCLERVGEVHVAGGSWRDGFYMDAHDGRVPEPVWDLLDLTLARAPWTPASCSSCWRNSCPVSAPIPSRANWSGWEPYGGAIILCR